MAQSKRRPVVVGEDVSRLKGWVQGGRSLSGGDFRGVDAPSKLMSNVNLT